jgi:osmoprotectant transport system ATP-binding protein
MTDAAPVVEFRNVSYVLADGRRILQELTFEARRGEILVLLGRSGSGKTTALKLINRLLEHSSGELRVDGRSTNNWNVIELRRHIGYAIQEVGLFPHYTVARNIALVPSIQKWPKDKIDARVKELLRLVGLAPEIAARYPHQLSGGQRQRVGVARALAADPPILLMDGLLERSTRSHGPTCSANSFRSSSSWGRRSFSSLTICTRRFALAGESHCSRRAGWCR